ncbi:hypothetical protein SAMN06265784_11625 [Paraburkholderia susongensis]|uniref:Uncharacterized protein n=1 Tax=Paraburkholderia susongensis TaxID=1515439 RepID=A0A1X7M2F9_9BURK|nr:hypothetical protein SAMN06265784_11625 [Paraburkholderia susongensis]
MKEPTVPYASLANPGFSQSTYEIAIDDGFMILR